jgi:DHA1 family bicyclomycin/chloramphenicol resistance-like MFS transporter
MRFLPLFAAIFAITPLAIDMYLPALLSIAKELDAPIASVQNSLSIYLAGYAIGMLIFGPMVDKFGRRIILISGLLGFIAFSFLVSNSQTIEQFLLFRFCQALSGSAATVVVPGAIKKLFGKDTAKGLSYVGMTMAIAPMIAPAFGTYILMIASWQWIFVVLIGYALVLIAVSYIWFPKLEEEPEAEADIIPRPVSFLKRYKTVFAKRSSHIYLLTTMLASLIFFTYITSVSFMYMDVFELSKQAFSFYFGINVIGLILFNFVNARLVPKLGSQKILMVASTALLLLTLLFFTLSMIKGSVIVMIASLIPCVCLTSIIGANADSLTLQQFDQNTGTVTAVIGTLRFGSGALAGPLLAFSFDGSVLPISTLFLISALSMVMLLLINRRREKNLASQENLGVISAH